MYVYFAFETQLRAAYPKLKEKRKKDESAYYFYFCTDHDFCLGVILI